MANINDYIIENQDILIGKENPFNEIDSMILARFSYLLFNKIELNKKETIESISKKMKHFPNKSFRYNGDKEMITNLGVSNRFKNMIVSDFVENTDKSVEKQFSAITIHISNKEMYISYIGTDDSIVGWKEDCNMSFMHNVPAQLDGLKYLNTISKKYLRKKIRVGGHSKGGNIALYASMSAPKIIQKRIIKVYNYDGPGFDRITINSFKKSDLTRRITNYIPQDSIVGRMLHHKGKTVIVKSIEKGVYQHDIFSWQVEGSEPVKLSKLTKSSETIYKTINKWLVQTTPEQRKIFIDSLFELFYSTDVTTFAEFSGSWRNNIPVLFKTYKEISEEDRKITIKMLKEFGKAYALTLRDNEAQRIENFEIKHLKPTNIKIKKSSIKKK